MTNAITQARTDVVTALAAVNGLTAFAYLPESLAVPAAVVMPVPGSTYVAPVAKTAMSDYPNKWTYNVTVMVRLYLTLGDNQTVTEQTDALIVSVCDALREADFNIESVTAPGIDGETYSVSYFATDITMTNLIYQGGS